MLFEVRLFTIYWAAMMRSVEQVRQRIGAFFTHNLHRCISRPHDFNFIFVK